MSPNRYKFLAEISEYLDHLGYQYIELPEETAIWSLTTLESDRYYKIIPYVSSDSGELVNMKLEIFNCLDSNFEFLGGIIEDLQIFLNKYTETSKTIEVNGFDIVNLETTDKLITFINKECEGFKCLYGTLLLNNNIEYLLNKLEF